MKDTIVIYFLINTIYACLLYWISDWKLTAFYARKGTLPDSVIDQLKWIPYVWLIFLAPIAIAIDCYYLITGNDKCFYTFKPPE